MSKKSNLKNEKNKTSNKNNKEVNSSNNDDSFFSPELSQMIINEAVNQYKNGKISTGLDAQNYLKNLLQPLMQTLLDTELSNHLNYSKYEHNSKSENARNGYCKEKTVKTESGNIKVKTPRDRNGSFEPLIIEKGQTKLTGFEDKCIALYAKGMSLRDIEKILEEMYKVKIKKDDISRLISAVSEETDKWRNRLLKPLYVFAYADCLYVPIKDEFTSEKKAIYVVIGIDAEGYKDILGIWIDKTESGSFWSNVFDDLKQRGVKDILYMCSDGIAGFKGSLEQAFPKTQTQRCVVHLVRNIYQLCPKKHAKNIIADYKKIYTSTSLDDANIRLEEFKEKYSNDFPKIVKKVQEFMQYLEPLFELPQEIRKCIYTTNTVESVNSALRKVTRGKGSFPNENAVFKVLYLRLKELKEKWNKPIQNWKKIQLQITEIFGDRYTKHINI